MPHPVSSSSASPARPRGGEIDRGLRRGRPPRARLAVLGIACAAGLAAVLSPAANATWSIVIVNTRTGEVGVASATCVDGIDLQSNTPILIPGVGGVTAQALLESSGVNRVFIRDAMLAGQSPSQILTSLLTFDTGPQSRQYGIVDVLGRAATFSGQANSQWAGGRIGRAGDQNELVFAIQGNILTGPCVVDAAVSAVLNTPGDLATRLIAGMEAAKANGGDGRCSCTRGPTICGCPPAGLGARSQSSTVAYLIIARAGDQDGCTGIYRTPGTPISAQGGPIAIAAADFNADGRLELVVANSLTSNLSLLRNATPVPSAPDAALPVLASDPVPPSSFSGTVRNSTVSAPRAMLVADFTGDNVPDALSAGSTGGVSLVRGTATAAWGSRTDTATPVIDALAAGPITGGSLPDAVGASAAAGALVLLRNSNGSLAATQFPVALAGATSRPRLVALANFAGTPAPEIFLAQSAAPVLNVVSVSLAAPTPTFSQLADIPLPGVAQGLVAADLNADGLTDLALSLANPPRVVTLTQQPDGRLLQQVFPLPNGITFVGAIAAGRLFNTTPDNRLDLAVSFDQGLAILQNTGDATLPGASGGTGLAFAPAGRTLGPNGRLGPEGRLITGAQAQAIAIVPLGSAPPRTVRDIALAVGAGAQTIRNLGNGNFEEPGGCATGQFYFNLNIPGGEFGPVDPVPELRRQFDSQRALLAGAPDAVQTQVEFIPGCRAGPGNAALVIAPRDLNGAAVSLTSAAGVTVRHAPGSAALAQIGTPSIRPDGRLTVPLAYPTSARGTDRFRIQLPGPAFAAKPVRLMPEPAFTIQPSPDYNGDASLTPDDLSDFVTAFFSQPPLPGGTAGSPAPGFAFAPCPAQPAPFNTQGFRADFNADCLLNSDDLSDFITAYFGGC